MTDTTKRINTFKVFAIVLAMAICLMIPIWQSSVAIRLNNQIKSENEKLLALEKQTSVVQAQIERQTSPEYVAYQAAVKGFQFDQISSITSSNVASNN